MDFFQIYISQISLMSHSSVIQKLLSSNENIGVQKGESIVFGVQTRTASEHEPAVKTGVQISSVQVTSPTLLSFILRGKIRPYFMD